MASDVAKGASVRALLSHPPPQRVVSSKAVKEARAVKRKAAMAVAAVVGGAVTAATAEDAATAVTVTAVAAAAVGGSRWQHGACSGSWARQQRACEDRRFCVCRMLWQSHALFQQTSHHLVGDSHGVARAL